MYFHVDTEYKWPRPFPIFLIEMEANDNEREWIKWAPGKAVIRQNFREARLSHRTFDDLWKLYSCLVIMWLPINTNTVIQGSISWKRKVILDVFSNFQYLFNEVQNKKWK